MKELTGCQALVKFGEIPYSAYQVMYLCADIRSLTEDTGFVPAVDFETGIRGTIRWMQGKCPI